MILKILNQGIIPQSLRGCYPYVSGVSLQNFMILSHHLVFNSYFILLLYHRNIFGILVTKTLITLVLLTQFKQNQWERNPNTILQHPTLNLLKITAT